MVRLSLARCEQFFLSEGLFIYDKSLHSFLLSIWKNIQVEVTGRDATYNVSTFTDNYMNVVKCCTNCGACTTPSIRSTG